MFNLFDPVDFDARPDEDSQDFIEWAMAAIHQRIDPFRGGKLSDADYMQLRAVFPDHFARMRSAAAAYIEALHSLFEARNDPRLAWGAFVLARHHEIQVPEWVLKHLTTCAEAMLEISGTDIDTPPPKGLDFSAALGFTEQITNRQQYEIDAEIFCEVAARLKAIQKRRVACEEVARPRGVSWSTVYRAFKRELARAHTLYKKEIHAVSRNAQIVKPKGFDA